MRKAKIAKGEPVLGYRVRDRRVRKGRPVAFAGPATRTGTQRMQGARYLTQAQSTAPPQKTQIKRLEYSLPVYGNESSDTGQYIAVTPTNTYLCPSGQVLASQYQYYKWRCVNLRFEHSAATTFNGSIALGWTPNFQVTGNVTDFDQLSSLPGFCGSLQEDHAFEALPRDFNQQFMSIQGCTVQDFSITKDSDPSLVPGYFMIALKGCTAAETDVVGNIYVTYHVELIAPVVTDDPVSIPAQLTDGGGISATSDWFASLATKVALKTWTHHPVDLARVDATSGQITFGDRRTYLVHFGGVFASLPTITFTGTDLAILRAKTTNYSTVGQQNYLLVRAIKPGGFLKILNASSTNSNGVFSHVYHMKRALADWHWESL